MLYMLIYELLPEIAMAETRTIKVFLRYQRIKEVEAYHEVSPQAILIKRYI